MRQSLRGLVNHLTQIGIPSGRVALEMQFTTRHRASASAPASSRPQAWFEIVKLEALAAKYVATAVQAARRLVVGLGDVQPERRARPRQARRGLRLALGARPDALRRPGGGRRRLRRVAHRGPARRAGRRALRAERAARSTRATAVDRRFTSRSNRRPRLRGERAARAARRSSQAELAVNPTTSLSARARRDRRRASAATAPSTGPRVVAPS